MSPRTARGYPRVVAEPSPLPTPRFKRVVAACFQLARGKSYVGVEHLFLAIIHDRDAVPTQVLARMVDLDAVESALLDVMNSEAYNAGSANVVRKPREP
jgi:ATP-dependent Clp protease ATP-binding subunit ClpA